MNTKRHTLRWTLAFAALFYIDAAVLRFYAVGFERLIVALLMALALAFAGVGIRRFAP